MDMDVAFVERTQIEKAVITLKAYSEKVTKKKELTSMVDTDNIHLQFSLKKILTSKSKTIKVVLPHSLVNETTEVCLFVKDLDENNREYEPTIHLYRDALAKIGLKQKIEIIPLKQLKLEFKPYELKRSLSNMYQVFLADARIMRLLPSHLGKHFYIRKRHPIQVDLEGKDVRNSFEKALSSSTCIMSGRGSSCQMTVGRLIQEKNDIVDNIVASVTKLSDSIPGGRENIRSLHIKVQDSLAVPVYLSPGSKDPNEAELNGKEVDKKASSKKAASKKAASKKVGSLKKLQSDTKRKRAIGQKPPSREMSKLPAIKKLIKQPKNSEPARKKRKV